MNDNNITREDVRGRSEVDRLCASDLGSALKVARAIKHPWYRCQATTSVAKSCASKSQSHRLLLEALSAAYEQTEPNRVVSVAAWPLRMLIQIDPDGSIPIIEKLLLVISQEPHSLRRLDGIASMFYSVARNTNARNLIKPALTQAANEAKGWRTERIVASLATFCHPIDPDFAKRLLSNRPPSQHLRQALKKINSESLT
jgi:hypothetical protein